MACRDMTLGFGIGLLVACSALLLGACGDEGADGPVTDEPEWSDPAGTGATDAPDGDAGAVRTAEALLRHLLERVRAGAGPASGPTFGQDVEAVAAVLWAPDAAGTERAAAQAHMQLATTAGAVAHALAATPTGAVDATETKIHAAWTRAAAGTPQAYRAWCAEAGVALLREREEALREKLFKK